MRITDHTPSDAGPWKQYSCEHSDDQHVVPGFERRRHKLDRWCWCHPSVELLEDGEIVHHNVAQ